MEYIRTQLKWKREINKQTEFKKNEWNSILFDENIKKVEMAWAGWNFFLILS